MVFFIYGGAAQAAVSSRHQSWQALSPCPLVMFFPSVGGTPRFLEENPAALQALMQLHPLHLTEAKAGDDHASEALPRRVAATPTRGAAGADARQQSVPVAVLPRLKKAESDEWAHLVQQWRVLSGKLAAAKEACFLQDPALQAVTHLIPHFMSNVKRGIQPGTQLFAAGIIGQRGQLGHLL